MSSTHRPITSEATPKFIARFVSTNGSSKVRLAVAGEVPVGNHGQKVQKNANEVGDNFMSEGTTLVKFLKSMPSSLRLQRRHADPVKHGLAVNGQRQDADLVSRCSGMDLGDETNHALQHGFHTLHDLGACRCLQLGKANTIELALR